MSFKALSHAVVGLCNSVFGDSVIYTPSGGSPVIINAVFAYAWVDIEGVISFKPTLRIKISDLISFPGKGDQVSINAVIYRVMESRLDAFGGSTLILQK